MTYGELKTLFTARLNRRDITPSLVEHFIKIAIQRAQRLLRVPSNESTDIHVVGSGFEKLAIPGDYLKFVSMTVDGGAPLARAALGTASRLARQGVGTPIVFARNGANFIIGPLPAEGSQIELTYLTDFAALSADSDSNWLIEIAVDLVISGALSAGCKHYVDPRADGYEDEFIKAIVDLNNQAAEDELTSATITPAYSFDLDD